MLPSRTPQERFIYGHELGQYVCSCTVSYVRTMHLPFFVDIDLTLKKKKKKRYLKLVRSINETKIINETISVVSDMCFKRSYTMQDVF